MDLSEYIQSELAKKDWKVSRLAKESGVSHVYIGYIIKRVDPNTGKQPNPSIDKLINISKALNVDVMNLVLAYQGVDPSKISDENNNLKYKQAIINLFDSLSKEDQINLMGKYLPELLAEANRIEELGKEGK